MRGGVKLLLEVLVALLILVVGGGAYAVMRLAEAPWAMPFATPMLERAMSDPATGRAVSIAETRLIWDRAERVIEIELHGVAIRGGADLGGVDIAVMRTRLSTIELLKGVLAPAEITLLYPTIRITRTAEARFTVGLGAEDANAAPTIAPSVDPSSWGSLDQALAGNPRARRLTRVRVVDADVTLTDALTGRSLHAPKVALSATREATGLLFDAAITLASLDTNANPAPGAEGPISLTAQVHLKRADAGRLAEISGHSDIRGLPVGRLATALTPLTPPGFAPALARAQRFSVPLDIKTDFSFPADHVFEPSKFLDGDAGPSRASVELTWGPGRIEDPIINGGGLVTQGGGLSAVYDRQSDILDLTSFRMALPYGALTATAQARATFGATMIDATIGLDQIALPDLPQAWPEGLGTNPRRWVTRNIQRGLIKDLKAHVSAGRAGPDQPIVARTVEVGFGFTGARVNYLDGMPPLDRLVGTARMTADRMDVDIKSGDLRALKLTKGEVSITDFQAKDQHILIKGDLEGELPETLDLLDGPKLGYIKRFGVAAKSASGAASTHLEFRFPAIDALSIDDVKIAATATVRNGGIPKAVAGQDVSAAELALTLDGLGMEVNGKARLGPVPLTIQWIENFKAKAPFQRRLEASGTVDDAGRAAFGLPVADRLTGPTAARVTYTDFAGRDSELDGVFDLKAAAMKIEEVGWTKPVGQAATARVTLALGEGKVRAIKAFDLDGVEMSARGSVGFDKAGRFEQLAITRLRSRGTDLGGALTRRKDGGYDAQLAGASFDARPLLAPPADPAAPETSFDDLKLPPLSITATLGRVLLEDGGQMTGLDARATHDGQRWQSAKIAAKLGAAPVSLTLVPGAARREFTLVTDDAGGVLDTLGVTSDVKQGHLEIKGTLENREQLLSAHLSGRDFQLVRAPFLARLLAVASITGIPNLLGGEGIGFSVLEADFTRTATLNTIKRARMSGLTMGLTAEGTISRPATNLNLTGTIVPVYSLNGVLNSVPLLGDLLTGGPGGGLFAFTYTAKGSFNQPDFNVNPLSGLTPSIVRNLFDWIGGSTDATPPAK